MFLVCAHVSHLVYNMTTGEPSRSECGSLAECHIYDVTFQHCGFLSFATIFFFFFLEVRSCYELGLALNLLCSQAGLQLITLLPWPPECWGAIAQHHVAFQTTVSLPIAGESEDGCSS